MTIDNSRDLISPQINIANLAFGSALYDVLVIIFNNYVQYFVSILMDE